ncbi:hypothetical protein [Streptomyces avicenniae]|uniref:hypothetical protein n=1 Tax=Streptomyces avicenniae TaxID=500153 RepID=UPI00069C7779|nr:hypothetical protein [Streptomyces avicenniae]
MNEWFVGACWLWCGHRVTLVAPVGTVSSGAPAVHAPLYACGPCVERLHGAVTDHAHATANLPMDTDGRAVPLYTEPGAPAPRRLSPRTPGRHRRPQTLLGRRWQRHIDAEDPDPAIRAARGGIPHTTPGETVAHMTERTARQQAAVAALLGAASGYAVAHAARRTGAGPAEAVRRGLAAVDRRWWRVYRWALVSLGEDPGGLDRRAPKPGDAWPDELHAVRLVLPDEFDLARRILHDQDGEQDGDQDGEGESER